MKNSSHSPTAVLRQHGKSFYWASLFLGSKKATRAARLYTFCRIADDLADQSSASTDIVKMLSLWQQHIKVGQSNNPIVKDILDLTREINLDTTALDNLLEGLISDLTLTRIADQTQLLRYSYLVAGTVGLMMCGLLGATDVEAKKFAVDLGIAMQLTNILRDVAEDARSQRQYVPQSWLTDKIDFFRPTATTSELAQPIFQRLHDLAEVYYQSAYAGMIYLPIRSRFSILIAARLYQEIGLQAKREGFPVLNKRIIVSSKRKCWLIVVSLLSFCRSLLGKKKFHQHRSTLHQDINAWHYNKRTVNESASSS